MQALGNGDLHPSLRRSRESRTNIVYKRFGPVYETWTGVALLTTISILHRGGFGQAWSAPDHGLHRGCHADPDPFTSPCRFVQTGLPRDVNGCRALYE